MRLLSRSDKIRISVRFILLLKNGGMKTLLNINEKEKLCPYKDPFPVASQQNTLKPFSLLPVTPITRRCSGYVLSEKSKWENLASANTKN
jgi:hypothetical protein